MLRVPPAAVPAWTRLGVALHEGPAPCQGDDPGRWTSDDPSDRAAAAAACSTCPAIRACAAYARTAKERCGVWGAIDRTVNGGAP